MNSFKATHELRIEWMLNLKDATATELKTLSEALTQYIDNANDDEPSQEELDRVGAAMLMLTQVDLRFTADCEETIARARPRRRARRTRRGGRS